MKTGIYVRVSTEEQAREGFSIRAQIEKLSDYAKVMDWEIFDIYKDEGISGKNIKDRPEVNRLLRDIEQGNVQNVLVFKIDRLTRSTKNLIELVEFFNEKKCAFNSLIESIDTSSATGRMFIKIIGIFAEFERENLIERVKVGLERKVKEGYSLCCHTASYGYVRKKGERLQHILPDEAKIVRHVFDLYINQGYSITKISHHLNAMEVKTKLNKIWDTKAIRNMLENSNYIGKVRHMVLDKEKYVEYEGLHEAIIDEETFFKAQERLKLLKKGCRTKHPKSDGYYTGVLYCSKCGSKMSPRRSYKPDKTKTEYISYRCIKSVKGACDAKNVTQIKLDFEFNKYIEQFADFTCTEEVIKEVAPKKGNEDIINEKLNRIDEEIEQYKKHSYEIIELFTSMKISFEEYQAMTKGNKEKVLDLEIERQEVMATLKNDTTVDITELALNLHSNWNKLDNDGKLEFLHRFVKKISVERTEGNHFTSGVKITELVFNKME